MIAALYVIPFLFMILVLWIMVKAFFQFERCKKTVMDGISTLGADRLSRLGWKAGPYVSWHKALPFPGSGWTLGDTGFRDQMHGLQRVAIHGLPARNKMDPSVQKSARIFRLYFWIVGVPGSSLVYLIAAAKIGIWLGGATTTPPVYWFVATVMVIASAFVLPFEKYRKWPSVEDMK
jgi:hypothetical protein